MTATQIIDELNARTRRLREENERLNAQLSEKENDIRLALTTLVKFQEKLELPDNIFEASFSSLIGTVMQKVMTKHALGELDDFTGFDLQGLTSLIEKYKHLAK